MASLGLTLATGGNVSAQLPISQTEGVLAIPLPASATTQLGLPFTRTPAARVTFVSAAGSVMNISGATLTAGAFATAPHSAVILGGINDGRSFPIITNTATAITISGTVPAGNVAGVTSILVIPDWTLGALFGTTNAQVNLLLLTGASAAAADKVAVEDAGVVTEYFFNSTANGWRRADGTSPTTDQANVRISDQKGVIVTRIAGGPSNDIVLAGKVRSGTQRILTRPGAVTIASNPFTNTLTLDNSGIKVSVRGANSPTTADKVSVDNGTTITQYYLFSSGNISEWRRVDNTGGNQGSVQLLPGRSVKIERAGGTPVFPSGWSPGRPKRFFQPVVSQPSLIWRVLQPFAS